ncbi:MAG: hypothetical protein QOJ71_3120 [Actinomycetota bacterium]|jgi:predicted RNA-binding Zn ribbon-like protein|nr:hypothetical protein [Actinomycetota bacterium]
MPNTTHSSIPSHPSERSCIDLVNSSFTDYLGLGEPVDRVNSREWRRWFFRRLGLHRLPCDVAIEDLVALRRDLRHILEKWSGGTELSARDAQLLDRRVRQAPLRQRVTSTRFGIETLHEPVHEDWTWVLATVTASAVDLLSAGDHKRLKTCSNPECSWMFYDNTINRSKQFCSTSPCGSLVRVRRFRERD